MQRSFPVLRDVVIASAVRTPIGSFNGALASLPAGKLGAAAVRAAVDRAGLQPDQVDEVYLGNVVSAGVGQAAGGMGWRGMGRGVGVEAASLRARGDDFLDGNEEFRASAPSFRRFLRHQTASRPSWGWPPWEGGNQNGPKSS